MSTFDGIVPEFPDLRIDRFLQTPSRQAPCAGLLSHVHTDHLVGLETWNTFIYCSSATREILLKLEKYPDRMNFANGILEKRVCRFERLRKLLRPIPLETPTTIELPSGCTIRVTLFDANHCVGAVMFLIEGGGRAILYTGDIRSEVWWVNSLLRNPILLPYAASTDQSPLKRLDNIYLDTTFASKIDRYNQFPPKASGMMELLRKVSQYPKDTVFYLHAWAFGYEEVMQALAAFLGSRIHLDKYKYGVYKSLRQSEEAKASEAFKLIGSQIGNQWHKGCLVTEPGDRCRIHSCEKGTGCDIWSQKFVRITPIISRLPNGQEMGEIGAGGGQNDLAHQVKLDLGDDAVFGALMRLCRSELKQEPQLYEKVSQMLTTASEEPIDSFITVDLADLMADPSGQGQPPGADQALLRHSSYSELCLLIGAFKPRDIHPCTVDQQNWDPSQSMGHLFGHLYSPMITFSHDQFMLQRRAAAEDDEQSLPESQSQSQPRDTQEFEERWNAKVGNGQWSAASTPARRPRRRSRSYSPQDDEDTASRRRRIDLEGSYWAPREAVDHYSPPRRTRSSRPSLEAPQRVSDIDHYSPRSKSRPSSSRQKEEPQWREASKKLSEPEKPKEAPKVWSQPTLVNDVPESPSRQINRWQRRIAQSRREASVFDDVATNINGSTNGINKDRRQSGSRQSENYGRLSPPPMSPAQRESAQLSGSRDGAQGQSERYGRLTPPPVESPSIKQEYDEMAVKRGMQQEAYDAALGLNGLDRSSIELVSVNGHQVKEEEL